MLFAWHLIIFLIIRGHNGFKMITNRLTMRLLTSSKQSSSLSSYPSSFPSSTTFSTELSTLVPLSFYNFIPFRIEDIENDIIPRCRELLNNSYAKGTLIVAEEGYNGMFTIPTNVVNTKFYNALKEILRDEKLEFNIGPIFDIRNNSSKLPYSKLIVKRKPSIITDKFSNYGISLTCNYSTESGIELHPSEWHERYERKFDDGILLDVRNKYESEMGTFLGSVPLNTTTYSESWEVLDNILQDVPKEKSVYMFCTGGIRCVKSGAYVSKLGYKNVYRLKMGIIGYEAWVNHEKKVKSAFFGKNYLFDRRRRNDLEENIQNELIEIVVGKSNSSSSSSSNGYSL